MEIPKEPKTNDVYSVWKPAHLKDRIEKLKSGEIIIPSHIQVDLTGKCNHNCIMCFYRNAGFNHMEFVPNEEIPIETGIKLFDDMADLGVPALEITGGGEPLLYPKIDDCLDRISKRNLELALVTNGSLLTKERLDKITNPKWLRFSMDSATSETRKLVHGTNINDFENTLNNLRRVVDKFGSDKNIKIGVSYIIQPENMSEIVEATKLFKEIGVDNIRFSYAFTCKCNNLLTDEQRLIVNSLLREAKTYENKDYNVFIMDSRLDDFSPGEKDFSYCGYQMFTFQIGCDSLVYPCCVMKYHKKSAFGDIRKQSLQEIIFGEKRKEYLKNFNVDKCLPCWLKHRNKMIEYLLVDNPPHINFV